MKIIIFTFLFLPFINNFLSAQSLRENNKSLSFSFGISSCRIQDLYVSANEYTGSPDFYGLSWIDYDSTMETGFGFQYLKTTSLKNRNTTATLSELLFGYQHLYRVISLHVLSHSVLFFMGPGIEAYVYKRDQHVAYSINRSSDLGGASFTLQNKLSTYIFPQVESTYNFSVGLLSYASGTRENEYSDRSGMYSPVSFLYINSKLGANYYFHKNGFVSVQYQFIYVNTTEFNSLRVISDRLVFTAGVMF